MITCQSQGTLDPPTSRLFTELHLQNRFVHGETCDLAGQVVQLAGRYLASGGLVSMLLIPRVISDLVENKRTRNRKLTSVYIFRSRDTAVATLSKIPPVASDSAADVF